MVCEGCIWKGDSCLTNRTTAERRRRWTGHRSHRLSLSRSLNRHVEDLERRSPKSLPCRITTYYCGDTRLTATAFAVWESALPTARQPDSKLSPRRSNLMVKSRRHSRRIRVLSSSRKARHERTRGAVRCGLKGKSSVNCSGLRAARIVDC